MADGYPSAPEPSSLEFDTQTPITSWNERSLQNQGVYWGAPKGFNMGRAHGLQDGEESLHFVL
jgi:hypothetical protein